MEETKTCPQCKLKLDISEFSKRTNGYVFARCKTCCNGAVRMQKECEHCKNRFPATDKSIKKYCSEECRSAARKEEIEKDPRISLRYSTISRAKREKVKVKFKFTDVLIPEVCPITGIRVIEDNSSPIADSKAVIDRKDLSQEYTPQNLLITSMKAFQERLVGTGKCSYCNKEISLKRVNIKSNREKFCNIECNRNFYNQRNSGLSGGSNTSRYDLSLIPVEPISRKDASAKGLPFYKSSKHCKKGNHDSARRVSNGKCLACEAAKRDQKTTAQNSRYHANRTDINQKRNQALRDDPKRRLIANLRSARSDIFKKQIQAKKEGIFRNRFDDDLGCTHQHFFVHIESTFEEGMNWENYGQWHLDHIKPISLFDNPICAEAWHYTNYQALWASDNIRKGGKNNPRLRAFYSQDKMDEVEK